MSETLMTEADQTNEGSTQQPVEAVSYTHLRAHET